MNFALVLMKYNPFGGYERQAALLADWLAARGHSVTVYAAEWRGERPEGVAFRRVPIARGASWLKVRSFARNSKRALEREGAGFDAVMAFDRTLVADVYRAGNACHLEWQAFRKDFGSPRDKVSMAVNPLNRVINSIESRLFSTIQREGGTVVVLSEAGKRQIRKHYEVDDDRFAVIPPAVDLARFDPAAFDRSAERKRLGLDEGTLVLLHVGSGFRIKGLGSTVRALAELHRKGRRDAVLLVAGKDRKEAPGMEALAKKLGVGDSVRFLGGVEGVESLYAASDVFVVPSLFETFGVVFVEALAMGLPVIAGRGAGAAGLIEREGVGTVVDVPAEPKTLAEAIEKTAVQEGELRDTGRLEEERRRRAAAASKCERGRVMAEYEELLAGAARRKAESRPAGSRA